MFFLSQVPTASPLQIGEWLTSAAAVAVMFAALKVLFVRKPSMDAEFATKTEISEMEDKIDSNNIAQVREQGVLHEKINAVAIDTAFIRGNLEGRSAERAELVDALREAMKK